jgi:hypothetical protein
MIMSEPAPEYPVGTTFSTTGADGKQRTWEVREDGQVKQVKQGKGEGEEEAPPTATQLPS